MKTQALPLEAWDQAIAQPEGNLHGLIHSDHGSQYVWFVCNDTLAESGIEAPTGTVGDSYDNALAQTVNGLYKTELIYSQQWESLAEVEFTTLSWAHWQNTIHPHEALDTPQNATHAHNHHQTPAAAPTR